MHFLGITFYFYFRLGLPEKQKIKNALPYYYSKLYNQSRHNVRDKIQNPE